MREIVTNTGDEPSVILNKVADGKGKYGCNAATGECGDMVEMGILDPNKVTRTALQNAASIEGLMFTTKAMLAEAPKKGDGHGHGGGGGGLGDMDFQGRPLSCILEKPRSDAGLFRGGDFSACAVLAYSVARLDRFGPVCARIPLSRLTFARAAFSTTGASTACPGSADPRETVP